jgi:SAM-dependent methyltransferase
MSERVAVSQLMGVVAADDKRAEVSDAGVPPTETMRTAMPGPRFYDLLYRRGAPWEGPPRADLVSLVDAGVLTPTRLPPGRALDLGCGSGANAVFLASHGFDVTGVDFSEVALAKARAAAQAAKVQLRLIKADLTAESMPGVDGPFDLAVDYGTLDDLSGPSRASMARNIKRLIRPGGQVLLWCFYRDIAWWRRRGARFPGGLAPNEEHALFAPEFGVERLPEPPPGTGYACFLLTRS